MTVDLSFTTNTTEVIEVPFTIDGSCTGRQVLMQKVLIFMLTSTDDLLRAEGGRLYDNLRSANVTEDSLERIENIINIAITDTVGFIKEVQDELPDVPDNERLSSIALKELSVPEAGSLNVVLNVISVSGEEELTALNLEV